MKLLKRSIALLLSLLLVMGTLPAAVFAVEPSTKITVGSTEAKAGDEIVLPVSISNNAGFSTASLEIEVPEGLVLSDFESTNECIISSGILTTNVSGKKIVINNGVSNVTANGLLFNLKLTVATGATAKDYAVSIKLKDDDEDNFVSSSLDSVPVTFEAGKVSVLAGTQSPDYVLKTLTFEGTNWDALIDSPQYGGKLLYGSSGSGFNSANDAYKWTDTDNTKLFSMLSEGYGSWCYWSGGHAVSNYVSGAIATYGDYNSQLTVYKQGVTGLARTGGGHNGSNNFAVHYGYADNSGYSLGEDSLPSLSFSDGKARVIDSMWVTNTCYALNCYIDGNNLTAKIGANDWVKIVATGYNGATKTTTAEFYLCNGPDNIVTDWTKWDLSSLGAVTKVTLNVTGSSDNGAGFSQPAYFAFDDVAVRFTVICAHEKNAHEAVAASCQAEGSTAYWSCSQCNKYFADSEGMDEIEKDSWVVAKLAHTDEKNNETGKSGKDGYCDVCKEYCNNAPKIIDGVKDVTANVVLGEAYLLKDLQAGKIFKDPDGDVLSIAGGGAGNAASKTNYYYNRSTDGGQTWGDELDFASALFGATTISLTETVAGTYQYRFYAKDGYGGDSRDNEEGKYWYLTLKFDAAANLDFDVNFYISQDQNYSANGKVYPIIKLWKSDGKGNKVGDEIVFTSEPTVVNNYNVMTATVKGGWYVYEGYGWNATDKEFNIPLGGMQIKIPADGNVDGNAGGGTNIYLRVATFRVTSQKIDNKYFTADDYTVRVTCPIMQCDAKTGTAFKNGNYYTYPVMLYAGGNSCLYNYYYNPSDAETYIFTQSINATIKTGWAVDTTNNNAKINTALVLEVTVPQDADFGLYFQYNNFNTSEQKPFVDWVVDSEKGTKTASYKISKNNSNYTWRMTDGSHVTKAGWLSQFTKDAALSFNFEGASTDKLSHDFSKLGKTTITRDEADIQVFVDPTGALALGTNTTRIRAYRMWQLINSDTANIMIEPDYTWTKLSGNATISFIDDSATVTGTQVDSGNATHNWADINANSDTSIFAVRYDSIDLDTSNNTTHAGFYPATNADRVAFVVVADTLGKASAHVQFNGDFEKNSRNAEWDYIYDTWYFLDTDANPTLDFTAKDAVSVEYAFGTTKSATMVSSVSEFTTLTANEGKYTVPLIAFNDETINCGGTVIIRMKDSDGKYSYQLVKVARMSVHIENTTYPGEPVVPGCTIKLTFDGLYRSINKISGIFNPTTFTFRYTLNGNEVTGTTGQYQQMDTSSIILNIPKEIIFEEGQDTTIIKATNGYVYGSMYSAANPFGAMYMMTDVGVGTNFNAVTVSFAFQKMADINIAVQKMPITKVSVNVVNVADVNDKAVITDADGVVQTPNGDGTYDLGFGDYICTVTVDGYIKEKQSFTVASSDNGTKTVNISLREKNAATWDGKTKTEPTQNSKGVYEIYTGAELAWFAEQVNAGTGAKYNAKLMNDISLNCENWTPIGNNSKKYSGTFNGNGHWVTDLYCNGSQYLGLFGYLSAATVKNLGVIGEIICSGTYAGGIAGGGNSTTVIDSCINKCNVTCTKASTGNIYIGGISGGLNSAVAYIKNCINLGTITAAGKFGGINGGYTTTAKIENCYNIGKVNNTSTVANVLSNSGAIASSGTVTNTCYLDGCTNGTKVLGTARTEAELKALAATLGEAFTDDEKGINNGFPVLTWQVPIEVKVEDGKSEATIPETILVEEGENAELDVTSEDTTVKETEVKVSKEVVEKLKAAEDVVVKSNVGSISFEKTAFAGIAEAAGESGITIAIKEDVVPDNAPGAAAGAKLIKLTAEDANGKNLFDGTKEGKATITVPYTEEVAEGNVPTVFYLTADGWYEKVDCTYDANAKTITFTVKHFSGYVATQALAPKEYKVSLTSDFAKVLAGEKVKISVEVAQNAFEGAEIAVAYDKALFTFDNYANVIEGATVTHDAENGKIVIQFMSATPIEAGAVIADLSFVAKEVSTKTEGEFGFATARVGETEYTYIADWPEAETVPTTVIVKLPKIKLVENYINGYTLVLIKAEEGEFYQYDGNKLYAVSYTLGEETYNYAYLVYGSVTEADAIAKLSHSTDCAGTITRNCDINNNGKITYEDAQAVFGVMNKVGQPSMEIMLRADVNGDGCVDSSDISAILTNQNYKKY